MLPAVSGVRVCTPRWQCVPTTTRLAHCLSLTGTTTRSSHTSLKNLLTYGQPGQQVLLHGWVHRLRKHREFVFIDLVDGSSMRPLQVVVPTDQSHR